MTERSLIEGLDWTLAQIDRLEQRDQEGIATDQAVERTRYIDQEIAFLHVALRNLHHAAVLLDRTCGGTTGLSVWRTTYHAINMTLPGSLPTSSIETVELALLSLISYTGVTRGMVRERTRQLVQALQGYIHQTLGDHATSEQHRTDATVWQQVLASIGQDRADVVEDDHTWRLLEQHITALMVEYPDL